MTRKEAIKRVLKKLGYDIYHNKWGNSQLRMKNDPLGYDTYCLDAVSGDMMEMLIHAEQAKKTKS